MAKANQKRLSPSVQIGDKVFLLGWKHLFGSKRKPRKFGFVVHINGGYIYVLPSGYRKNEIPFELYHSEFRVVKRYKNRSFNVGETVSLVNPGQFDWGKARPRSLVQIVGVKRSYLVVRPVGLPSRQFNVLARDLVRVPDAVHVLRTNLGCAKDGCWK